MVSGAESHQYPVLVEQMTYRTQVRLVRMMQDSDKYFMLLIYIH